MQPLATDLASVSIAAVASRDLVRARAFADRNGIERCYGSYGALLDDAGVDAVYIPLPNTMHEEWTCRALSAGKHVLCEKPLAISPLSVERMMAQAAASSRVLMEAMHYRFHPDVARIVEDIAAGMYGVIVEVEVEFRTVARGGEDIRLRPELGGGALTDLGCYGLDLMLWLGLDPQPTVQSCGVLIGPTGVDLRFDALLLCQRGATRYRLCCDIDSNEFVCRASIKTSRSQIVLSNPFLPVVSDLDGRRLLFAVEVSGDGPTMAAPASDSTSYFHQLQAFRDRIIANFDDPAARLRIRQRSALTETLADAWRAGNGLPVRRVKQ